MSKPITDIDDARLVKALAHPLRVRILAELERRTATPKELAIALKVPLENLSYHVRALRDFGFIQLEGRRMVRGAVEHRYSLAARPRITAAAWDQLPTVVREALDAAALSQIAEVIGEAAQQGKMNRAESHVARQYARLDEQGFLEASALVTEALDRLARIEAEAEQRLKQDETLPEVPAILIAMLFDAPDKLPAPEGHGPGADAARRPAASAAKAT
jgi:DNA-binding transcriptional ArsR family regulator